MTPPGLTLPVMPAPVAGDKYVSHTGSDGAVGTLAAPYATLRVALARVPDGGTVWVCDSLPWNAMKPNAAADNATADMRINARKTVQTFLRPLQGYNPVLNNVWIYGAKNIVVHGFLFAGDIQIQGCPAAGPWNENVELWALDNAPAAGNTGTLSLQQPMDTTGQPRVTYGYQKYCKIRWCHLHDKDNTNFQPQSRTESPSGTWTPGWRGPMLVSIGNRQYGVVGCVISDNVFENLVGWDAIQIGYSDGNAPTAIGPLNSSNIKILQGLLIARNTFTNVVPDNLLKAHVDPIQVLGYTWGMTIMDNVVDGGRGFLVQCLGNAPYNGGHYLAAIVYNQFTNYPGRPSVTLKYYDAVSKTVKTVVQTEGDASIEVGNAPGLAVEENICLVGSAYADPAVSSRPVGISIVDRTYQGTGAVTRGLQLDSNTTNRMRAADGLFAYDSVTGLGGFKGYNTIQYLDGYTLAPTDVLSP